MLSVLIVPYFSELSAFYPSKSYLFLMYLKCSGTEFFELYESSVLDPDPCGSVLKWLPWIRIRIGNTDPDPGQSIWCPREKDLRLQV